MTEGRWLRGPLLLLGLQYAIHQGVLPARDRHPQPPADLCQLRRRLGPELLGCQLLRLWFGACRELFVQMQAERYSK